MGPVGRVLSSFGDHADQLLSERKRQSVAEVGAGQLPCPLSMGWLSLSFTEHSGKCTVEVCMGMHGKTGISRVPWDSHGNGSKISHGMGMGWELSAWEWEL